MPGQKGIMRERLFLDKDVYTLALERVNHCFDIFDTIGVAFSGGKDSTAVLQLLLEVARERGEQLPLRVIHFDEEANTQDTVDYVRRVSQMPEVNLEWYCLPTPHQNACSREHAWWYPWDPEIPEKWVADLPPEAITGNHPAYAAAGVPPERMLDFYPVNPPAARWSVAESTGWLWPADKYGSVGFMLGIRADESLTRYRAVIRKDIENYIIPYSTGTGGGAHSSIIPPPSSRNVSKVYPIYDWSTEDVWVAPMQMGWDYNRTYDKMSMHGTHPTNQRVAPPWHPEGIGNLPFYPACYPELWDKMTNRVHGVNTAAKYARTELYNYGTRRHTKADHLTWEEFIKNLLERHEPSMRAKMAKRIAEEIRMHYKVTDDPILEYTHHPETGLAWRFLYTLASRGDPMNRKIAASHTYMPGTPRRAEQELRYKREYDQMIEDGRLDPKKRSGSIKMAELPTDDFGVEDEAGVRMGDA